MLEPERAQCVSDSDCAGLGGEATGSRCVSGLCEPLASLGCMQDTECGESGLCVGGFCQLSAAATDPAWSCLDEQVLADQSVAVVVPVSSLVEDGAAVEGVEARLCRKVDPACEAPVATVVSGRDGFALDLPPAFVGYLEVTERDYYPLLYFLPSSLRSGMELPPLTLLQPVLIASLADAVGVELDPDRGHILLTAEDCLGQTAAGLRFDAPRADSRSDAFYVETGLPSRDVRATSMGGSGGWVNVLPGSTSVMIELADSGENLTTVSLLVRAGFITMAWLDPLTD